MHEKITDPAELAEAAKAWEYVKELRECGLLDPEIADEPESLAMVRGVFERARADALRSALDAPQAEAAPKAGAGEAWVHSTDGCADGWALVHRRGLNRPDKILVAAHDAERVCALLNANHPSPAGVVEAARAVRDAALVNYNTPQEYDVACAQRAACEMAALASLDAAQEPPRAKPGEGGEGGA